MRNVTWRNRLGECHGTWDCLSVATELPPSKPSIDTCLIEMLYRLKYPDLFGCCYKGIFVNFTPVRAQ